MTSRAQLIEWIRAEIVGPSRPISDPKEVIVRGRELVDVLPREHGPIVARSESDGALHEVLAFRGETPHRKYGAGLLHPEYVPALVAEEDAAAPSGDTVGIDELESNDVATAVLGGEAERDESETASEFTGEARVTDETDEFEVVSPDVRYPATIGVSFCASIESGGAIQICLPLERHFSWQAPGALPLQLNGLYQNCHGRKEVLEKRVVDTTVWRRQPAVPLGCIVEVSEADLINRRVLERPVPVVAGCALDLVCQIFPRRFRHDNKTWLLTVVLRNRTHASSRREAQEATLYQSFFEVFVQGGALQKYPESTRSLSQLDDDEKSLALLYRESATWAIGHGCAAAWDTEPGEMPASVFADVMPAVELPSMTPDIEIDGRALRVSMNELSSLSDEGRGAAWEHLEALCAGYEQWIDERHKEAQRLPPLQLQVAEKHLKKCKGTLARMRSGLELIRVDDKARRAFRLANMAMLLQQIATKHNKRRSLAWNQSRQTVVPDGSYQSPWDVYRARSWKQDEIGSWRVFQLAFLLMSICSVSADDSVDREIVDLIWFPTGGGKTEAYLGLMAYYMFHQRLLMESATHGLACDGTNVLMRYTLRMLTTQQFQRAASLICAMEFLRRRPSTHGMCEIPGKRFSLGLWIGRDGSPNDKDGARAKVQEFRKGISRTDGNPLVLTECPWCRAEIGRLNMPVPRVTPRLTEREWNFRRVCGIQDDHDRGPSLVCPDADCEFGKEDADTWLPVEVIDTRIYEHPPSIVISTADKLAIIAYKPEACALFGRRVAGEQVRLVSLPPGLIVQDELHLISGPLGTMYALYEGVIERLCSYKNGDKWIKPKLVASTATIRGADEQVKSLYNRSETQLFPSPGLSMGDSFFGRYARRSDGKLASGRLYLGIHATDYGSILTTQVRAFAAALCRPWFFAEDDRDPWWTLLAFYNSIRELSGARTLFDSDIRSRVKFLFNRENIDPKFRRNLSIVEELTSRLSQAGIVKIMDDLSIAYSKSARSKVVDACLASNIIEVGVDIDRLSLMGVVGQPKTTATYIQVTGRVGRRWWSRPGLILMVYNPSKSRDRSHYEQFHGYHRRLYERVEPTTATPFAVSAIQRGFAGALIAWARVNSHAAVGNHGAYARVVEDGYELLKKRCQEIQKEEDRQRSLDELARIRDALLRKWAQNPKEWHRFPPRVDGEYLMLWPGQYRTPLQERRGVEVPSSMRQVDGSAELYITEAYAMDVEPD